MLSPLLGEIKYGVERHGTIHLFSVKYQWHRGYAYGPDNRHWRPPEVEVVDAVLVNNKIRGDGWRQFASQWFTDRLGAWGGFYENVAEACYRAALERYET